MQVFKAFMKVLRKKLFYATMYISIFLGIAIPMSINGNSEGTTREMFRKEVVSSIGLCIFDEDKTPESENFINYLSGKYTVKELKNDEEVIINSLYYTIVDRVITIPEGFSEKLEKGNISGIIDSKQLHESLNSVLLENDINSYLSAVSAYITSGENTIDAMKKTSEALSADAEINILNFDEDEIKEYPDSFSTYLRYMAYFLIASIIGTLCPVLMVMNQKEVRFRSNCSSIRPTSYTKQLFLGSTIFVMAVWLIFIIAGIVIYGGLFKERAWLAVLNSFILALTATSISVLISSFCNNSNLIVFINQVISLGMSFLCGVFVDHELMSEKVLSFSRFFPVFWYIKANNMLNGTEAFDSTKLTQYFLIEAAFAVVIALITLLIGKVKYSAPSIISGTTPAPANK